MPILQIICLANSRKYQGRCVAGLRVDGQGWLRPIGRGHKGALSPGEYRLREGGDPHLLDLIEIDVSEPCPDEYQPENWRAGSRQWHLLARPAPRSDESLLREHLQRGPDLFGDESDRVSCAALAARPPRHSLALVPPADLKLRVDEGLSQKKYRACFVLDGAYYDLGITDPAIEKRLVALPPGLYRPAAAGFAPDDSLLLTVSLGEPFERDQCCYKLVAGIMAIPREWRPS